MSANEEGRPSGERSDVPDTRQILDLIGWINHERMEERWPKLSPIPPVLPEEEMKKILDRPL